MGLRRCGLGSLIGQPGAAPPLGTEPVGNSGAGYAGPPAAASTAARAIHGGPAGQVRQQGGQPGSWTRALAWARCSGPGRGPQQHHPGEVIARGDRQARRNRGTANVAALGTPPCWRRITRRRSIWRRSRSLGDPQLRGYVGLCADGTVASPLHFFFDP